MAEPALPGKLKKTSGPDLFGICLKTFSSFVAWPLALDCLHGSKQELELPDGDAVASQHAQQLHQQVGNNLRSLGQTMEKMLYKGDLSAGLQVPGGLPKDGDEHGPDLSLKSLRTVVEQFQHVANVFRVLDYKVELHVKFASNKQVKNCIYNFLVPDLAHF